MADTCNDRYPLYGVVFRCQRLAHTTGDHTAPGGQVTWPQHADSGARWVIRQPGALVWHRVETRSRTACGIGITGLTLTTIRGRTLARPPADAMVCPTCLAVAPWVTAVAGSLTPAA